MRKGPAAGARVFVPRQRRSSASKWLLICGCISVVYFGALIGQLLAAVDAPDDELSDFGAVGASAGPGDEVGDKPSILTPAVSPNTQMRVAVSKGKRPRPPPPPYFFPRYWNASQKASPTTTFSPEYLSGTLNAPDCVASFRSVDDPIDANNVLCKYQRASPISCDVLRSRCKWRPDCYEADECTAASPQCRIRLLAVIPVQGGGTEFMRTMLRYRGFDLGGEADGTDGTVGWVTVCDGSERAWNYSRAAMRNDGALGRLHSRFRYIVHQVRHPLHQIRSNLAFCDPRDFQNWVSVWDFIETLSPGVPYRDPLTGEFRSCLHRSMLYYLSWNRYIETVADFRVRIESPSADLAICKTILEDGGTAMLPLRAQKRECAHVVGLPKKVDKHSHGGFKRNTTWTDVVNEDPIIAKEIAAMAVRYGYPAADFDGRPKPPPPPVKDPMRQNKTDRDKTIAAHQRNGIPTQQRATCEENACLHMQTSTGAPSSSHCSARIEPSVTMGPKPTRRLQRRCRPRLGPRAAPLTPRPWVQDHSRLLRPTSWSALLGALGATPRTSQ
eukprot:Amastigsp_a510135_16.p1 type:complete len:556 gc:universal Amastigsp_a510135_16:66-1733(+)